MFTYIHHSGRFDRTPESLAAALTKHVIDDDADVIGFTETASESRGNALLAAAPPLGWTGYRAPGMGAQALDECTLLWDASKFTLVEANSKVVSDIKTYSTKGRPRPPFSALFVVLRETWTDEEILFVVAHTPSHVQDGAKWFENNRAKQHREGLKEINATARQLGRKHGVSARRVISMDLNLDVAQPWVRAYLATTFIGPRLYTDSTYSDTLGKRTIDIVLVGTAFKDRGKIKTEKMEDSDHKSIILRIEPVT